MKLAVFLLAFLISADAFSRPVLEGRWRYYKKIYGGTEMPESPGATLRMYFEYGRHGESHLYWWHEGEKDHCSRKGRYRLEGSVVVEEVIWVDPKNTFACAQDPDMQLGRQTRTPFFFHGVDLALRFHLGDEPLDLVWRKESE